MKLLTLEQRLTENTTALITENNRHAETLKLLTAEAEKLLTLKKQVMLGADVDRIANAEAVIYIRGFKRLREDMIQRAINDALADFKHLRVRTLSIKDYERFSGQEVDCEYGYGPSHGYIVSEIGLKKPDKETVYSEDQLEDVIYFLNICRDPAYIQTRLTARERQ